jgi:hypothetical protein
MAKLKIAALQDDKAVKVTVELPATVHRDLVAYAKFSHTKAANLLVIPLRS